jgi:cell division protein FtsB
MRAGAISTPLTNLSHLPRMVSRARLKSILTGLALYAMAAAIVGYFGVNAYTGKYGLNARQELDQEIVALTSELAQLKVWNRTAVLTAAPQPAHGFHHHGQG